MTIHDLRGLVYVQSWGNDERGALITYCTLFTHGVLGDSTEVYIKIDTLLSELLAISSIDSNAEYHEGYKLSQWDALNLAIRHEYFKYLESDIDNSDIGKALNNLSK